MDIVHVGVSPERNPLAIGIVVLGGNLTQIAELHLVVAAHIVGGHGARPILHRPFHHPPVSIVDEAGGHGARDDLGQVVIAIVGEAAGAVVHQVPVGIVLEVGAPRLGHGMGTRAEPARKQLAVLMVAVPAIHPDAPLAERAVVGGELVLAVHIGVDLVAVDDDGEGIPGVGIPTVHRLVQEGPVRP
ncbi:MAG: hypothetical protein M1582_02580, partial [Actinobacteria bacterium]|nr:hypothetical protein [Actinomycetota bacterium]